MKNWVSSRFAQASATPSANPIHINHDYLKTLLIKYVSLSVLVLLNFLLFVGGVLIVVVAAAHSLDVNGGFLPTSVFWSGVITCATGFVFGGLSGWALITTRVDPQLLVAVEPQPQTFTLSSGVFRPFLEGIVAGLMRPRSNTYHEESGFPAA